MTFLIRNRVIIVLSLVVFVFSSCATLFTKKTTKIKFEGSELNAEVYVKNSKKSTEFEKVGNIPCEVSVLNKGKNEIRYLFSDGTSYEFKLKKKFNGLTLLNVFNYGVGIPVDLIKGKFFKPKYKFYFAEKKSDKVELYFSKKRNYKNNKKGGQNNWLLDHEYYRPSIAITYVNQSYGKFEGLYNNSKDSINSEPFFYHQIPLKTIGNKSDDANSLLVQFENKKLANELIKAWWYDEQAKKWNYDKYLDRCIFNASDAKYFNSLKTNRGTKDLLTTGILNETYLTNIEIGKIYTYEEWYDKIDEERAALRKGSPILGRLVFPKVKRRRTGFVIENSKMKVFKLNYDEQIVNRVANKYVLPISKGTIKESEFYNEKFDVKHVCNVNTGTVYGGVKKRKNNRRKKKGKKYYSEEELFTICLQNNNFALNDEVKYTVPNFNIHTGIFESTNNFIPFTHPLGIKVKVGKKEKLFSDTKYVVYKKKLKKDGTPKWVYAGGIISTNKIGDNRGRDLSNENLSTFRQISGLAKVKPGMMIEEIPDNGWSFSYNVRLPQKDSITNSFNELRFERNISKRINRKTKYNGDQKKFPTGIKFFFEYLRGSSEQVNYGIRSGNGDENLFNNNLNFVAYRDSTIDAVKNKVPGYDKNGVLGKTINIKRNSFNIGFSKEFPFYTFISISPYFSVGLDFENVRKKNKTKAFVFQENREVEKIEMKGLYSTATSFNYGCRVMAALNLRFQFIASFNRTQFATLRYYDLNYFRSKNSVSFGFNWSF